MPWESQGILPFPKRRQVMTSSERKPISRRKSRNHVIDSSGKPLLVIVEGQDIEAMVDAGIATIGGLDRTIGHNRRIVLKPNTNQRDPFPSITAPETIRAVARHCRLAGAEHIVVHEDHKFDLDPYYTEHELPGMDIQISYSPEVGHYVLVEYEKWHGDLDPEVAFKDIELTVPANHIYDGYQKTEGPCLRVARQLQEAPVVINLPVVKRHFAGQMTSALKNHFGSVYGAHRWLAHGSIQTDRDYYDRKLAEFASAVRPELTITDVRSIQAVSGPFRESDTKIVDGINRLIITGDMIAADVVAMDILKKYDDTFTSENEAIVRRQHEHAEELSLGTSDLTQCKIIELKV
jgi:uncharacterized protein (DUF362 family)